MASELRVLTTPTAADRAIRNQKQVEHVKQLWIFLASVLLFFTLIRTFRWLIRRAFLVCIKSPAEETSCSNFEVQKLADAKPNYDIEKVVDRKFDRSFIRRTWLCLQTFFKIGLFRCSIPIGLGAIASVAELCFICVYITAMFIWLLVDTRDLNAVFYQDRAALLASSQLPLIVALAGKNNIISFMTGIGHEKLNVLHRTAARTNLVLLWLHAITRTVSGLPAQFDFSHNWMRSGAVGLAAFTFATFLSTRAIRNMAFEFFLLSHIALILVFLVCGYFHTKEQNYGDYIWPALLIWAIDRVMRGGRILYNNLGWLSAGGRYTRATIELLSQDTVRVTLVRKISWMPGQHAYICLPTISAVPTEAHPFSIASLPEDIDNSKDKALVFLIRARGGFTQKLKDHAVKHGTTSVPALLDGPYGCPPDLIYYSTCIFVAGGSGISYTLPLFMNLIRENTQGKSSRVRRIVFIWAVRSGEHLNWISTTLIEALSLSTNVYITGSDCQIPNILSDCKDSAFSTGSKKDFIVSEKKKLPPVYRLIHGRPSIRRILHDEILLARGPVSVDVAGPSKLTESVRKALSAGPAGPSATLKGVAPVTLHVESFGMSKS
ncbi:FAD-binding domain-containing protein [Cyathus striatus]|nr:FAD-binding domain-containing protein [Cyathus striatus]